MRVRIGAWWREPVTLFNRGSWRWLPVLLSGLIAGCGGDGPSGGGVPKCTPGTSLQCACLGNASGVQLCSEDGTFGDCQCAGLTDAGAGASSDSSTTNMSDGHDSVDAEAPEPDGAEVESGV